MFPVPGFFWTHLRCLVFCPRQSRGEKTKHAIQALITPYFFFFGSDGVPPILRMASRTERANC